MGPVVILALYPFGDLFPYMVICSSVNLAFFIFHPPVRAGIQLEREENLSGSTTSANEKSSRPQMGDWIFPESASTGLRPPQRFNVYEITAKISAEVCRYSITLIGCFHVIVWHGRRFAPKD